MFNEIKVVYRGDNTPFFLETNKNIDENDLKLFKYDEENEKWVDLEVSFNNVVNNIYKTEYKFNELGIVLLKVIYKDDDISELGVNVKDNILDKLYNYNFGNWEIKDNKMIFYDLNGEIIATYNLFDGRGRPNSTNVFKRDKN